MKIFGTMAALSIAIALAACGSTSDIKPGAKPEVVTATPAPSTVPPATSKAKPGPAVDLSSYDKVVVLDFVDATDKSKLNPDKARAYADTMTTAGRTFPDLIAQKIRDTKAFSEVVRSPGSGHALIVSGSITRLAEGNGALRLLVGMGAGSSYFDATTNLSDAESGQNLGEVTTGKNSWALGGGIAASQTVESFMKGAADKIATQLRDSKQAPPVAKAAQ